MEPILYRPRKPRRMTFMILVRADTLSQKVIIMPQYNLLAMKNQALKQEKGITLGETE
jgi:hypothetical protein